MPNFLMRESTAVTHVNGEISMVDKPTELGAVAVRRGPISDVAAVDGAVLVTNYGDDTVALLNPFTFAVDRVIAVPGEPVAAVVSGNRAYVSTSSANFDVVSVIDTTAMTIIASYELAFSVTALAVSPNGKRVFAGRTGDGYADVAVIDTTADRVGTIDIATGAGMSVDAVKVDGSGRWLYVGTTDTRGSALVVVDLETTTIKRAVQIGAPIRDIASNDGIVYVLTSDRVDGGAVHIVDPTAGAITGTVALGVGTPMQIILGANDTRAYIVDYDHIALLCTLTLEVIDTITVGPRPSCVALDADNGRLHVADYAGGVTTFAVAPSMHMLQLMATDPICVPEMRELEPAGA
jgi:DNA-binding beta-propeller fold protein YncE